MFDGNVIYEMNPVGEINVPQEDKKPNMNDDGKGKISIANGSSCGVRYVECHSNTELQNIQCELSPEQIIDLVKHGENVVLKLEFEEQPNVENFLYLSVNAPEDGYVYFSNTSLIENESTVMGTCVKIIVEYTPDGESIYGKIITFTI